MCVNIFCSLLVMCWFSKTIFFLLQVPRFFEGVCFGLFLSMSIVTVQLGQCGNQIGFEVFDALFNDSHCSGGLCSKRENEAYQASCKERFFSEEENGGMCGPHNQSLQGQALHMASESPPSCSRMILFSAVCFCVKLSLSSDILSSGHELAQILPI